MVLGKLRLGYLCIFSHATAIFLVSGEQQKSKMAAAFRTCNSKIRQISRLISRQFIVIRTIASHRNAAAFEGQRKQDDNVYLLNNRPPPLHSFREALDVLRAYAISNLDETVELHLKLNMGEKKVHFILQLMVGI